KTSNFCELYVLINIMDKNIGHCTPKLRFWEMVLNFVRCHGFISEIEPNDSESWQFTDGVVQYLTEQLDGSDTLPKEPFYVSQ
ncbi:hypothetical protein D6D88_08635, partial [Moraxella catarrhalis]